MDFGLLVSAGQLHKYNVMELILTETLQRMLKTPWDKERRKSFKTGPQHRCQVPGQTE